MSLAIDGNPDDLDNRDLRRVADHPGRSRQAGRGLDRGRGKPVTGRTLTIRSDTAGWSLEVYGAATGPPTTLQGWGSPIGKANDVGTDQTVELTATSPYRYYLLWITKLASGESGYNVAIGEVELSS